MTNRVINTIDNFLFANKQRGGLDMPRDDSSSVTSISSVSRSGNCKICGEPESLPSKPFIKCPSCNKKRMHAFCHQPSVDPRNIPKYWKCKACQDANAATSLPSFPPIGLSVPSPNLPAESSTSMNGKVCKEPGCNNPIFQSASTVCHKHKVEQQYKNAQAMKPVALNTTSGSKPIKKKNLYNWKLDDELKHLKRKRGPAKRSVSDTRVPAVNGTTEPQKEPRILAVSDVLSSLPQTPEQRAPQFSRRAEMASAAMDSAQSFPDEDFSLSIESPISIINTDLEVPRSRSGYRSTPQSTGRRPSVSPEYSPPPPVELAPDERNTLWAEPDQDHLSPRLQIDQELQVIVNRPEDPQHEVEMEMLPVESVLNSVQPSLNDQEDEEMPDVPAAATVEEPTMALQQIQSSSNSPALTSISPSTTPAEDIIDADRRTEPAQSLEEMRKQKAATFDHNILDSFLARQAKPKLEMQPTPQELVQTQLWGHIDPRKVWPKEISDEWLAKKREEIDSRGGRKANFGKLLTAQVRKERWDNGWHIHQNRKVDEKDRRFEETTPHVEELFGLKGIDDLIPGVRDGQLVMMEEAAGDENGKKKRKPKVYPVL